jgi:DNA-binding LytR/AlgR family response regulator
MDRIHIAACDDDPGILDVYSYLIAECFLYHNISASIEKFTDPLKLPDAVKNSDFELLFLDIDMPGVDGITLAKRLRASGVDIDIIYVSSKEELVFKVFDIQPYSFIRKNKFLEEIAGVVRSYVKSRESGEKRHFVIQQRSGDILTLDLNKTLYFEGEGKNQKAYMFMNSTPLLVQSSMKELEERLAGNGFIRVHKGFLVNYQFIDSIKNSNVILTNGGTVPISRRNVNQVKEQYLNLMKWDKRSVG